MSTPTARYASLLEKHFPFSPTADQGQALEILAHFLASASEKEVMILQGYAGTGKTTLIQALVGALQESQRPLALLAPTGRAAKVMSQYSGAPAFTIHKFIYLLKRDALGRWQYQVRQHRGCQAVIVVDEASMINDGGGRSLLADLLKFARQQAGTQVLLVGDTAQLPPVHQEESPALDRDYLRRAYGVEALHTELREVMRQRQDSVILQNATELRNMIREERLAVPQWIEGPDVQKLQPGFEVEDTLHQALDEHGREEVLIITRSNKRAVMFNQQVRQRVLWQEDEISAGDLLMVVRNNYHWLPAGSSVRFIANGDTAELLEIYEERELYDRRFARVKLRLIDYPEQMPVEAWMHLDTLTTAAPALSSEELDALNARIAEDYRGLDTREERERALRQDPIYNALQVKYAYAVTGHKAQGGQWSQVFVEHPFLPEGQPDREYLRWLYTAFTRARDQLFLLGFEA
ncbi:MAG: AAA family ATPase [Schleiferiaceae bacterium]|nr:AAA family ATPase [Schleiferiaceae bacterium]